MRTTERVWCRWRESNSRPSVYKTAALPLCYTGVRHLDAAGTRSRRGHYSAGALRIIRQNLAAGRPYSPATMLPVEGREIDAMTGLKALAGSVTGKVTFIGLLILVLLIPLGMIEGLVHERSQLYGMARDDIGRSWGEAQIVGGPILVVPFSSHAS